MMRVWSESQLSELYRAHMPNAVRLAYLLVGNRELAEDLCQDAFIRVVGRFGHIRDREAFGAYLRRAVINQSKMYFRRRDVERRYIQQEIDEGMDRTTASDLASVDLLLSLGKLPRRQRIAVVLRYFEGMSGAEIAATLGCPTGTVRSLLSRGLTTIRKDLGVSV